MKIEIPGIGHIFIDALILDLNGTLAIVVPNVNDVLDLFIHEKRLRATLRK